MQVDNIEVKNEKQELINSFAPTKTYIGSEIRSRINEAKIKNSDAKVSSEPTSIKRGDVIIVSDGKKNRPAVIVKKIKDRLAYIPITSGENVHSTISFNSRFFGSGYFTLTLNVCDFEYAKNNFIGVFEDNKAIRQATEYIKNFYKL